ncbi:uncharacterized protein [Palaemon carinicauda]|uniref:uncharacterized protein isoform X4 n=1 Tax=Palaemon carinicauda TaxID=392227 RepID=UPI0035B5FA8C
MKAALFILCVVPLALTQSDRCVTRKVDDGKCRLLIDCPALSEMAEVLSNSTFAKDYGGCGTDENENLMVCCPVNATTDVPCEPPGVLIPELGCIIHVPTSMTWYRAQTNCLKMNGQLVEGFTKEQQSIMYENFKHAIRADPFVGIRHGRWALSKEPVPNELWVDGYGEILNLTDSDCGIGLHRMQEYCCDCEQASICQIKL